MKFTEDSRVKIPCILHLVRLGYQYLSLKNATWDEETNIFPELFRAAIAKINPGINGEDIERLLTDIKLLLDNEDLGKAFYEKLTERSGTRLIDFTDFSNNSFHVVTELTCKNGDDEFRPDLTLLINGMPLIFIEVKKPNNREGVLAERNRINTRCRPRADWGVLQHYKIPVPKTDLLEVYQSTFEEVLKKIYLSSIENKKLSDLRDWLLPMLMNGQVTVA